MYKFCHSYNSHTFSDCTNSDRRCSRQDGGCGYRGVGIGPIREGSRIETPQSHSTHYTGFCDHRYEILGREAEETVLKTRKQKLFGIALVR
jgi:hypothetical protein